MLPTGFLQDLLTRVDIVDIVGRQVTLKKAGINHKGLCPFHGEKTPSFTVSPSRQTYHCFGCGAHGDAIRFITETTGAGFMDAVRELAGEVGITVPDTRSSPEDRARAAADKARQVTLTDVLAKAAAHYREALKASPRAIDYLKGRGLSGQVAARFGLGYAPEGWRTLAGVFPRYDDPLLAESGLVIQAEAATGEAEGRRYDRFRDRIMFPIRSVRGEVIGFGGRVLDRGEPKYLNSPETPVFHKGQELYGLYEARQAIRKSGYVLVVEGYMDVVALAQAGLPHAVATLGTACTADHLAKLFRFTDSVVFSFDGDAAGRKAAARALEAALPHASDTRSVRFLFLPAEHDPDSYTRQLGPAAFEQAVADAVPLSSQLMTLAAQDCDLDTPEGRARTIAQARPLVAALPEGLLREQVLQALAERAGMGADALRQHWGAMAAAEARRQRRPGPAESWGGAADAPEGQGQGPAPAASDGDAGFQASSMGADGTGWRRSGRSAGRDRFGAGSGGHGSRFSRRPTPQAATRLDRAAWLLVRHAPRWQGLSDSLHGSLCAQPAPHGPFFAALERVLLEHGPVTVPTLLGEIQAQARQHASHPPATEGMSDLEPPDAAAASESDAGLAGLIQRIRGFHALDRDPPESDLDAVLRQLELVEIDDELRALTQADNPVAIDPEQLRALYARKKLLTDLAAEPSPGEHG